METFIQVNTCYLQPMTRSEYSVYRGWDLTDDEDGSDKGFLVEGEGGGVSNHTNHDGPICWKPEKEITKNFQSADTGMSFGCAVHLLKKGKNVARKGWNGKGMFLTLVENGHYDVVVGKVYPAGLKPVMDNISLAPWVAMKTAQNTFVPWLASQSDMLADDWVLEKY